MSNKFERGIDIEVPVSVAYNQWTQFEEFPRFMKHVQSIRQIDDKHLHWTVELGGQQREFDAVIVEQVPDKRIAWHSVGEGLRHSGVVTFHRLADSKCRVMVQLEYDPQGFIESLGGFVGAFEAELKQDLNRFVEFIEKRGAETGSWRGRILNKHERRAAGHEEGT